MESSALGRVALVLLVPCLLLPIITGAAVILVAILGGIDRGVGGIILVVYLFVLLGSMTLNAWLLLRHPHTLSRRALPWASSVVLVVIWGTLIIWMIVLVAQVPSPLADWLALGFAVVLILASTVSFFLAASRGIDPVDRVPFASLELGTHARVVLWIVIVASVLAMLSYAAQAVAGNPYSVAANGALGGPATWVLVVLGLPWSHPLYLASVLATVSASSAVASVAISTVCSLVGVTANGLISVLLLLSPNRRVAIVNWFFRLKPRATRTPAQGPQP